MTKSTAYTKLVPKALDRHAIVVVRINPREFELREREHGELFATIRSVRGKAGKVYSYKLVKEQRVHKGFTSLKSCVARVLAKV